MCVWRGDDSVLILERLDRGSPQWLWWCVRRVLLGTRLVAARSFLARGGLGTLLDWTGAGPRENVGGLSGGHLPCPGVPGRMWGVCQVDIYPVPGGASCAWLRQGRLCSDLSWWGGGVVFCLLVASGLSMGPCLCCPGLRCALPRFSCSICLLLWLLVVVYYPPLVPVLIRKKITMGSRARLTGRGAW